MNIKETKKETKSFLIRISADKHLLVKRYSQALDISMNDIFNEFLDKNASYFERRLKVLRTQELEEEKQLEFM